MNKERLEEINNFSSLPLKKRISLTKESIKKELKANDYHFPKNITINTKYLLEIIKQAERVQELENEYRVRQTEYLEEHIDRLEKQNKRYREALSKVRYAIHTQVSSVNRKENSELERGKILGMTFASKMMNRYFDDLLEGEE